MHKYSKELIKRIIDYLAKNHDHHINEETANEYLDSYASLYLVFSKIEKGQKKKIIKT